MSTDPSRLVHIAYDPIRGVVSRTRSDEIKTDAPLRCSQMVALLSRRVVQEVFDVDGTVDRHQPMVVGDVMAFTYAVDMPETEPADVYARAKAAEVLHTPDPTGYHTGVLICTHVATSRVGSDDERDEYWYFDNWGSLACLSKWGLTGKAVMHDGVMRAKVIDRAVGGRKVYIHLGQRYPMMNSHGTTTDRPCWAYRNLFLTKNAPLCGLDPLTEAAFVDPPGLERDVPDGARVLALRKLMRPRMGKPGFTREQIATAFAGEPNPYASPFTLTRTGTMFSTFKYVQTGSAWRFNTKLTEALEAVHQCYAPVTARSDEVIELETVMYPSSRSRKRERERTPSPPRRQRMAERKRRAQSHKIRAEEDPDVDMGARTDDMVEYGDQVHGRRKRDDDEDDDEEGEAPSRKRVTRP